MTLVSLPLSHMLMLQLMSCSDRSLRAYCLSDGLLLSSTRTPNMSSLLSASLQQISLSIHEEFYRTKKRALTGYIALRNK